MSHRRRQRGWGSPLGLPVVLLAACAGAGEGEVETYRVDEIEVRTDGNISSEAPYRVDTMVLELEPGEGKEYKYRLEEGRTMVYSWRASGEVRTEMHSEEDDTPEGSAEFFEVLPSADGSHGTFTAPFPGIHGWYWENLSQDQPVTVTLRSAGFYTYGAEFPSGLTHQLQEVHSAAAPD